MSGEIGKLGKHTVIYGLGILASKATGFIMLPVYTRYLSPSDYGVLELLGTTLEIIAMISAVGLTATVFKFYSEYDAPRDKDEVISTVVIMMVGLAAVTAMLGVLVSPPLAGLVFADTEYARYFRVLFAVYFFQSGMAVIPLMYIRAVHDSLRFVGVNLCKLVVQVSLNVYFLVFLELGVLGALYSALIAELGVGCYVLFYTLHRVGFKFSALKCRRMLRFGYPFIFVSLGGFLMTSADRYFLNVFSDLNTVGLYALAYKFGFILSTVAFMPFNLVWDPQRFEIAKRVDGPVIFRKVFLYCNIVIASLSLLICLFVRDFLTIMSAPSYLGASRIVPLILVMFIFQLWWGYCNIGLFLKNQGRFMATSALLSAVVAILLLFILVPRYGAYGAGLATICAWALRFVLVYRYSQVLYPIDYAWGKQSALLAMGGLIYGVSLAVQVSSIPASLVINAALMTCYLALVYRFSLTADERAKISADCLMTAVSRVTGARGLSASR